MVEQKSSSEVTNYLFHNKKNPFCNCIQRLFSFSDWGSANHMQQNGQKKSQYRITTYVHPLWYVELYNSWISSHQFPKNIFVDSI